MTTPNLARHWEAEALSAMKEAGAYFERGHYVFTNRDHSENYVNKDVIVSHPDVLQRLASWMAQPFKGRIDAAGGPAVAGAFFGVCAAQFLGVRFFYADKDGNGGFHLKRGYEHVVKGKRVLIVEDVLTTGLSAAKTVDAVRTSGGIVVGVSALWNRTGVTAKDLDVPELHALINVRLTSFRPSECPFCKEGRPIQTNVGHGAQFIAQAVVA